MQQGTGAERAVAVRLRHVTDNPSRKLCGVHSGAKIGLIDYGQSKQLPLSSQLAFAQLVHALDEGEDAQIGSALSSLGVVLGEGPPAIASRMAYGMFDTRGR